MTRSILASTAALALSAASALAGGLAPPIQPIGNSAAVGSAGGSGAGDANVASGDCAVVQPAVAALQEQGFTRVDVTTGGGQARFNAVRGDVVGTYVYDCATGALLSQEAAAAGADLDRTPGVMVDGAMSAGGAASGEVSVGGTVGAGVSTGAEVDAGVGADAGVDAGAGAGVDVGAGGVIGGGVDAGGDAGGTVDVSPEAGGEVGAGVDAGAEGSVGGSVGGGVDDGAAAGGEVGGEAGAEVGGDF